FKGQKDPSDKDCEIAHIRAHMLPAEREAAIDAVKKAKRVRNAVRVVFVAPGGTGTLHELSTLLQLKTHGHMLEDKKIVLLNFASHLDPTKGFWDPLIAISKKLGFDDMLEVAATKEEAIAIADREYVHWIERNDEHKD